MRFADAIGAGELLASLRLCTLRRLARAVAERLTEWADAADERAGHSGPKVIITVRKEWESRAPVEMQRDGDSVMVWAGGRFLKVKL